MRVLSVASTGACGIATYTQNLIEYGLQTDFHPITDIPGLLQRADQYDLVHLQHEFGLMDFKTTIQVLSYLNGLNVKSVLTAHTEEREFLEVLDGLADGVIFHVNSFDQRYLFTKSTIIPHGIPVYEQHDREALRRQYGFEGKKVIATTGFIAPAKLLPHFVNAFLPFMEQDESLVLNLVTSKHQAQHSWHEKIVDQITTRVAQSPLSGTGRIQLGTGWWEKDELTKRLQASDIGYMWGPASVNSNSGSVSEMIGSRLPVVINDVTHMSHLTRNGYPAVPNDADDRKTIQAMVDRVIALLNSDDDGSAQQLDELRNKYVEQMITALRYERIVEHHHDFYHQILED